MEGEHVPFELAEQNIIRGRKHIFIYIIHICMYVCIYYIILMWHVHIYLFLTQYFRDIYFPAVHRNTIVFCFKTWHNYPLTNSNLLPVWYIYFSPKWVNLIYRNKSLLIKGKTDPFRFPARYTLYIYIYIYIPT